MVVLVLWIVLFFSLTLLLVVGGGWIIGWLEEPPYQVLADHEVRLERIEQLTDAYYALWDLNGKEPTLREIVAYAPPHPSHRT